MYQKTLNHALIVSLVYATTPHAFAAGEVVTDATIGTAPVTSVVLGDTIPDTYDIVEALGERSGSNLFHSFLTFNIDSNEIALFSEDVAGSTTNVISRVTGGSGSLINGTISNISGANFWFVDTAGVMIGADAVFDVSGALSVGAVDYIDFGGPRFYALPANQVDAISTLSVTPTEFGFLPDTTSGDLTIDGLNLDDTGGGAGLEIGDITLAGNNISITDSAIINDPEASGSDISIAAPGDIVISNTTLGTSTDNAFDAGNISVDGGSIWIRNGSLVTSATSSTATGMSGQITASAATELTIDGSSLSTATEGEGDAGSITLTGDDIALNDGTAITSSATGAGGSSADPVPGVLALGSIGRSGDITITAATEVTSNVDQTTGLPDNALATVTISTTADNEDSVGPGAIAIEASAGNVYLSDTAIASATISDLTEVDGGTTGAASIAAAGALTLDGVSVDTSTQATANAGTIQLNGFDVSVNNGSTLNASSEFSGSGAAGDIDIAATNRVLVNVDAVSLDPMAGSAVSIHTRADGPSAGGSDLSITGGDVLLANLTVYANNNSTATTPTVGSVSISAIGGGSTGGVLEISNSFLTGDSGSNGSAPSMLLSSSTSLDIANTTIFDATFGAGAGGVVDIVAGTDLTSTGFFTVLDESFSSGNAGAINLDAGGDMSLTGANLQTPSVSGSAGEAGTIELSAGGSLTLANSTLSAPARGTGDAGTVRLSGDSLTLTNVNVTTTTASNTVPLSTDAGDISIDVAGAIDMTNSTLLASTTGDSVAGDISLNGSSFFMDGGQIAAQNTSTSGGTGAAGSITFNAGLSPLDSFTIIGGGDILADAGTDGTAATTIDIVATGAVQISGTSTDEAEIKSSASSGSAANINIEGSSVTLNNALVSTEAGGAIAGPGASISVTATDPLGSGVDLTDASVIASSSGAPNAGAIFVSADNVSMSGGTLASSSSGSGNSGNIYINYFAGPVGGDLLLSDGAQILAEATGSGSAGFIIAAGDAVDVQNATLSASATGGASGFVALLGESGISISDNSSISASATGTGSTTGPLSNGAIYIWNGFFGTGSGGDIDISDSALNIDLAGDAQAPNSFIWVNTPGSIALTNAELSSTTTDLAGDAGTIAINGAAFTMAGGFLRSSTTGSGDAGDIQIEGTGSFFSGTPSSTGQVTISGDADISATAGEGSTGSGSYGAAGAIDILSSSAITLAGTDAANRVQISSSSFAGAGQAGTITLSGTDLTTSFASLSTETASANGADTPASISLSFSGDATLSSTQVLAATSGAADAGTISLSGYDVALNDGTQLSAPSTGAGAAGTITIDAVNRVLANVDPISLLPIAGAPVLIETRADGASSGAGDLTISGGDVLLANINVRSNNNSTVTTPDVGSVTITAIGGGTTTGVLDITGSYLNGDSGGNGSAPSMLLSSLASLDIAGTTILDATFGTGAGGVIDIVAGTDLTINGLTVLDESFSSGNAGAITLTAGGNLSMAGANLQTPGIAAGEAGTITLNAMGDLLLTNSLLSAPGQSTGDAGTVNFSGDSLTMTGVTVTTTTASAAAPLSSDAGDITIDVVNAISLTDSILRASTSGNSTAGDISFSGNSFFMDGGQIAAQNIGTGTGAAGSITFNDLADPLETFTIVDGGDVLADAGSNGTSASTIQIYASGAVQISGNSTDTAEVRSSASSGTAANIAIQGSSITLADALISTEAGGTVAAPGASISLTATDAAGPGVDLIRADVVASSSGAANAGSIDVIGPLFQMAGGSLQSSTSGTGNGGTIQVNWPAPTGAVSISGGALLSAGSTGAGDAGFMIIAGDTIDVQDATLQANSTEVDAAAGFVALIAENGITVTNSTLNAISSGISNISGLSGGSIYLLNGLFTPGTGDITLIDSNLNIDQRPQTPVAGDPSCPGCGVALGTGLLLVSTPGSVISTNTILSSTTSGSGAAGDIFIEGADFTMTGGLLQTSTTGSGDAGSILISGPNSYLSGVPTATGAVSITGGADIRATAGIEGATAGTYGRAGTIKILSNAAILLSGIDASNPTEISSSSFAGAGLAGTINLAGTDLTADFARLSTETASLLAGGTPASIDLQFGNGDVLLTNTAILASTNGAASAGNITIDAASITAEGALPLVDTTGAALLDAAGNPILLGIESSSTATQVTPDLAGAAGSILFIADALTLGTEVITSTASDKDTNAPGLITAMIDGSIIVNGGLIEASTTGDSDAGSIELNGHDVLLDLNPEIRATSTGGQGLAGSISILGSAGVAVTGLGATINSSATGIDSRGAGSVLISAGELNADGSILTSADILLTNADISSSTSSDIAPLTPGSITIEATGSIAITGGSILTESLAGSALAGNITIGGMDNGLADPLPAAALSVADSFISSSSSGTLTSGSAGSILLQARTVDISAGSAVESRQLSQSAFAGASGTITIQSDQVNITDSSLSTATASNNTGVPAGGLISVTASNSGVPGAGTITMADSTLESSTSGVMRAGDIFLSAENVNMSGGMLASSSSADGSGGNIFINYLTDYDTFSIGLVPGTLQITDGAQLLAEATGDGAAGFIIAASELVTVDNSILSAAAQGGNAGFVALLGESGISIDQSTLNASSAGAGSNTGNISSNGAIYVWNGFFDPAAASGDIDISGSTLSVDLSGDAIAFNSFIVLETPDSIRLTDSTLSATASSTNPFGNAGDIYVNGSDLTMTGGSLLSSTTGAGDAGSIQIAGSGNFVRRTNAMTGQVTISGGADIQATAGIEGSTGGSFGNAGTIDILSDSAITLAGVDPGDLVEISSSSFVGAGQAGTVTLHGTDLSASFASLSTETASTAVLGAASLDLDFSGDISFADSFALASTSGATDAGNIAFKGTSFTMSGGLIESSTTGTGNAGSIVIAGPGSTSGAPVNTGPVSITGGADIRATAGEGPAGTGTYGDAGTIDILSDAAIILAGIGSADLTEISSSSFAGGGQAGTVTLTGTDLTSSFAALSTETASTAVGTAASINVQMSGDVALAETQVLASTSGSTSAGDVTVTGSVIDLTSNTQVAASSSASGNAGNVGLFATDDITMSAGTELTARSTGAGKAGSVTLDAGNLLAVTGARVESSSLGTNVGVAGSVALNAAAITLTDAFVSTETDSDDVVSAPGAISMTSDTGLYLDGTQVTASTSGDAAAGSITLDAGTDIELANQSRVLASTSGGGKAGNVSLYAGNAISLPEGMLVAAQSTGAGNAGSVVLDAGGPITITGATVESSSLRDEPGESVGLAGFVTIQGGAIAITDGLISTRTDSDIPEDQVNTPDDQPEPGAITVISDSGVLLDGSTIETVTTGMADAGDIYIEALAADIDLSNESTVTASTSAGGDAGDVTLVAAGAINLPMNTEVSAKSTGPGDAGSVSVNASGELTIDNAVVTSSSDGAGVGTAGNVDLNGSGITITSALVSTQSSSDLDSDAPDDGVRPGTITVTSPGLVFMQQGSRLSASVSGAADGGDIFITANDLTMIDGSVIETRATGAGNSGSVTLNIANDLTLLTPEDAGLPDDQTAILTNSLASQGGTITADIGGVLFMDRSRIESSVETADGKGGDIVLTTNGLFMVGSQILARADQGNGGAIFINRGIRVPDPATDTPFDGLFIIDAESLINADSNEGVNGEVNIDSPDADLTAVVEIVDARIVEDPTLADDVCNPSNREAQSSFIVEDQGGIAPPPDGYFSAGVLSASADTSAVAQRVYRESADAPQLVAAAGGCK